MNPAVGALRTLRAARVPVNEESAKRVIDYCDANVEGGWFEDGITVAETLTKLCQMTDLGLILFYRNGVVEFIPNDPLANVAARDQ